MSYKTEEIQYRIRVVRMQMADLQEELKAYNMEHDDAEDARAKALDMQRYFSETIAKQLGSVNKHSGGSNPRSMKSMIGHIMDMLTGRAYTNASSGVESVVSGTAADLARIEDAIEKTERKIINCEEEISELKHQLNYYLELERQEMAAAEAAAAAAAEAAGGN